VDTASHEGWRGQELGFPTVQSAGLGGPAAAPDLCALEWDLAELEASLRVVSEAADAQVDAIEASTFEIERECARVMHEVRSHTPDLPEKEARSLLVFSFPRDASKATMRSVFGRFGTVDSAYLVHRPGASSSYCFVNFAATGGAAAAHRACCHGQVVMWDKKGREWTLGAEWQKFDVKKRPKKHKRQGSKDGDNCDALDVATAETETRCAGTSALEGGPLDLAVDASSSSSAAF
jgi:hypothetical protein